MPSVMSDFKKSSFAPHVDITSAKPKMVEHDVCTLGSKGPTVVIIQELPGIGPETIDLAKRFASAD